MRRLLFLLLLVIAGCSAPESRESTFDILLQWEDQRLAHTDSLVTFLQSDDAHIRLASARCAGRIGRNDVTAQLIQLLQDPSDNVKKEAAIALGFIDNFRSADKLTAQFNSSHKVVRQSILFSFGNIDGGGKQLLPMLNKLSGAESQTAWDSMRKRVGDIDKGELSDAINTAIKLNATKPNTLWRVLRCAEKLDSIPFETEVIELLASRDQTVRAHACRVLSKSNSPVALVKFAEKNLRNEPDFDMIEAIRSIGKIEVMNEQVAQFLGTAVRNSEPHIARTALDAITTIAAQTPPKVGASDRISLLPAWRIKLLNCAADQLLPLPNENKKIRHPVVRASAVEACCALRGPGLLSEDVWSKISLDRDSLVRQSIWRGSLSYCITEKNFGDYAPFIAYGIPEIELLAAVESLGPFWERTGSSEKLITKALLEVLTDTSFATISVAAEQLGNFPSEENIIALCQTWDDARSIGAEDIKWAVLTSVDQMSEKGTSLSDSTIAKVTAMIEAGFDSDSARLRKKARTVANSSGLFLTDQIPSIESLMLTLPAHKRSLKQPALTAKFDTPKITCETEYGNFTIELNSEVAPNTCAAFLSQLGQELTYHRVVPGFVIQGGDPDGSGWGGPGYNIRSEWSDLPYLRGTVGIAHSGKDTGGSQFFIALTEQPHPEGRYTVFGKVTSGLKVIDKIQPGDSYKLVSQTDAKP